MKNINFLKFKVKAETVKKSFNFRDFFGFSSLIFGLLLSNTSYNKSNAVTPEVIADKKIEKEVPLKKNIDKKAYYKKKNQVDF